LAQALLRSGRADEAAKTDEETLKLTIAKNGRDHPDTLITQNNLAEDYESLGDFARAETLLRDRIEVSRGRLGADDPQNAAAMSRLGSVLLRQSKFVEAEPILRECLAIRETTTPDHWTRFNTQSQLGAALLGQQRYSEAMPLTISGYQGMKEREATIPPQGRIRLPEAAARIVRLYEAIGNPEKAFAIVHKEDLDAMMPNGAASFVR
jgi:tetratricopeptide (TPR) repeat protein